MSDPADRRQRLELHNRLQDCERLAVFLRDFLATHGHEQLYDDLRLVLEEVFVNIVNYAFEDAGMHKVSLELAHQDDCLRITFTDRGAAFDPTIASGSDIGNNAHECGGMGLHLIRALTDVQKYQRIDGQNVFTLIRYYT